MEWVARFLATNQPGLLSLFSLASFREGKMVALFRHFSANYKKDEQENVLDDSYLCSVKYFINFWAPQCKDGTHPEKQDQNAKCFETKPYEE